MDDTLYLTLCNDGYNMFKNDMASLFEQLEFESEDDDTWYYPDGLSMANGRIEEFMINMTQDYISSDCIDHRKLITSTQGGDIL